jgi:PAS domain-containing protein
MFRYEHNRSRRNMRFAIVSLLLLSASSLIISLWFVVDFAREQEIVESLLADLPSRDLPVAQELAGELQWQSRWTLLVIVQVVATALAVTLLSRAYLSSQDRLNDVKALAADILSSMEQAVITCDADGIVTSLNHRTMELLETTTDPFGRSLRQLTDKIDLAAFRAEADSNPNQSAERDFSVVINSNRIWLRGFCQPLRNSEGEVIGNVFQLRDVTADRHLQERIARMERFMGLGSLAAGLHH